MELIYRAIYLLRTKHRFQGYIHVKAIPGADADIIKKVGFIADRMSINLEFPTAEGLKALAPNKHRKNKRYNFFHNFASKKICKT